MLWILLLCWRCKELTDFNVLVSSFDNTSENSEKRSWALVKMSFERVWSMCKAAICLTDFVSWCIQSEGNESKIRKSLTLPVSPCIKAKNHLLQSRLLPRSSHLVFRGIFPYDTATEIISRNLWICIYSHRPSASSMITQRTDSSIPIIGTLTLLVKTVMELGRDLYHLDYYFMIYIFTHQFCCMLLTVCNDISCWGRCCWIWTQRSALGQYSAQASSATDSSHETQVRLMHALKTFDHGWSSYLRGAVVCCCKCDKKHGRLKICHMHHQALCWR